MNNPFGGVKPRRAGVSFSGGSRGGNLGISQIIKDKKESDLSSLAKSYGGVPTKIVSGGITYSLPAAGKMTADAENQLNRLSQIEGGVTELEKMAYSLPAGRIKGGLSSLRASITGGESQPDANLLTYNQMRPAFAVGLYRALTGDNRLSDVDASSRALPLLWHPSESDKVRTEKFNKVKILLQQAKSGLIANQSTTSGNSSGFQTPVPQQPQISGGDKRQQYNDLRASGVSVEEAKKRLGF